MMINGLGEIRRGEVLGTEHDEDLIIKHEITRHNLKNLKLNILSGYKDDKITITREIKYEQV